MIAYTTCCFTLWFVNSTTQHYDDMASTLVKIDIHLIFHVRSTGMTMYEEDLDRVFAYIGGIIRSLGGLAIEVGGRPDHVHILCSLPKTMTLADFVRTVKAESSKWMRSLPEGRYAKFSWQEGYGAFSVSPSLLDRTVEYIRRQAEHHRRWSFKEEYMKFLDAYGIHYDERYAFGD